MMITQLVSLLGGCKFWHVSYAVCVNGEQHSPLLARAGIVIGGITIAFLHGAALVSLPAAGLPVTAVAGALSAATEEEVCIADGIEGLEGATLKAMPLLVLTAAAFDTEGAAAFCCSDELQAEAALEAV